jgi:alpha/beta superfamily hydrolase
MAEAPTGADVMPAGSSWSDSDAGTTEEASFIGPGGGRILAFLHRPTTGAAHRGVVLCSSLYEDFQVNYRMELLVARALARRGCAAVRFHYRGQGNSDDLPGGMTSGTMLADARAATSWLLDRTGVRDLTFVGSRLGAFVAAELAWEDDHTPLVLWSPIVEGEDFFRGLSRASRVAGVRAEAGTREARADAGTRSAVDGAVERLGNLVLRASQEDLATRELPSTIGSRRVLLVSLSLTGSDNPQYAGLVSRWTAGGAAVDVLRVRARQLWMVPDKWEPVEERPTTVERVDGIAEWVAGPARELR